MKTENKDNKKVKNKTIQEEMPGKMNSLKAFFKNDRGKWSFSESVRT
jgi:hypothetical protein